MAKTLVHVGIAVSTDGLLPSRSNILNIAAAIGDRTFNKNVTPQGGVVLSDFWKKHSEEFEQIRQNTEPLPQVIEQFRDWLNNWQGNLIACTSSVDFWHLMEAMLKYTKKFPFGPLPLDTNSFYAAARGSKTPIKVKGAVLPVEVAKERWNMVTGGVMPDFNKKSIRNKPALERLPNPYIRHNRPAPDPPRQLFEYNPIFEWQNNAPAQAANIPQPQVVENGGYVVARMLRQQRARIDNEIRIQNQAGNAGDQAGLMQAAAGRPIQGREELILERHPYPDFEYDREEPHF